MKIEESLQHCGITRGLQHFPETGFNFEQVVQCDLLCLALLGIGSMERRIHVGRHVTVSLLHSRLTLPRMWDSPSRTDLF
jgi:hypothetical protein